MKNKKQLKELFDTFSKDFKELLNEEEQPTLEEGRWYKLNHDERIKIIFNQMGGFNYGFNSSGGEGDIMVSTENGWTQMTDQEVIDMAKNYLEGTLGFTEGCKFKCAICCEYEYSGELNVDKDGYIKLTDNSGFLFDAAHTKWATLIKEEPLLWLDGSEIVFECECVWINKVWFNKEEIQALSAHPIFQKILDRMNKTNQ